jgi:hypothetical protein
MESNDGVYSFGGSPADLWLDLNSEKVGLELSMQRWKDMMAELVPTGKNFIGNMGYSMLKYRALLSSGKIRVGETETSVKGRSYFQKVRMSSITPCWYWATVQWDNGAYLQYFLPHLGIPIAQALDFTREPDGLGGKDGFKDPQLLRPYGGEGTFHEGC